MIIIVRNNNHIILDKPINIIFNSKQECIIKKWFEVCRQVYNLTIKYLNRNKECKLDLSTVRKKVKHTYPNTLNVFIKNSKVPLSSVDNAISDAIKAKRT